MKQRETTEPDCNDRISATVNEQLFGGWDTDEDTVLSQVEIPCFKNNIPETEILTNTQFLHFASHTLPKNNNGKPKAFESKDQSTEKQIDENESIVTESWHFVDDFGNSDDEDILESALDEFENSQQVSVPDIRRVPLLHVKSELNHSDIKTDVYNSIIPVSRLQNSNSGCQVQRLQTSSTVQRNSYTNCQTTAAKSNFSFFPRSMYENTMNAGSRTLVTHSEVRNTRALTSSSTTVQRRSNSQGNVDKHQENVPANQRTVEGKYSLITTVQSKHFAASQTISMVHTILQRDMDKFPLSFKKYTIKLSFIDIAPRILFFTLQRKDCSLKMYGLCKSLISYKHITYHETISIPVITITSIPIIRIIIIITVFFFSGIKIYCL